MKKNSKTNATNTPTPNATAKAVEKFENGLQAMQANGETLAKLLATAKAEGNALEIERIETAYNANMIAYASERAKGFEMLAKLEKGIEETQAKTPSLRDSVEVETSCLDFLEKTTPKTPTPQHAKKVETAKKRLTKAQKALNDNERATEKALKARQKMRYALGIIDAESLDGLAKAFSIQAIKTAIQSGGNPENAEKTGNATGGNFAFMYSLYTGAVRDNTQAEKDYKTPFSDAKDIAQRCAVFLWGYNGKCLSDSANNGETDKNGQPITIARACFRDMNEYINGERQHEYKRAYVEDENGAFYEIPLFWDMPTITDYKAVCKVIEKLKLSHNEKRILRLRMQGKSLAEIAFALSLAEGTVKSYCNRIKGKAKAFEIDETTAKKAVKIRKMETQKRKAETESRNENPSAVVVSDFESKTTAEKIATLKRLYKKAIAKGNAEKASKIKRYAVHLVKKENERRITEKKAKEIEKRLARLVKQANGGIITP